MGVRILLSYGFGVMQLVSSHGQQLGGGNSGMCLTRMAVRAKEPT